jgi:hypothetical protein
MGQQVTEQAMKNRIGMSLKDLRVNPLSIVSSFLLLIAPFTNWIVLSGFGIAVGSSLWDVATNHTNFLVSTRQASSALYSGILLVSSGILLVKSTRFGLLVGSATLATFTLESYSMFGTFGSGLLVLILPGVGFLLAFLGLLVGMASHWTKPMRISDDLPMLATRKGLTYAGLLVGSIAFVTDGWVHWSTGHLSAFLGSTPYEETFHVVPWISLIILLAMLFVPKQLISGRLGSIVVLAGFTAVILDAAYHTSAGSVASLVGDSPSELLLHALSYYSMASLMIARFLLKR